MKPFNGIIYSIYDNVTCNQYVGSTTLRMSQRKALHKYHYKKYLENKSDVSDVSQIEKCKKHHKRGTKPCNLTTTHVAKKTPKSIQKACLCKKHDKKGTKPCNLTSFICLANNDYKYKILAKIECENLQTLKEQLKFLERSFIDTLENVVNHNLPGNTKKQWREDNRESINKKAKIYYDNNRESILEKAKLRYQNKKLSV